MFVNAKKGLLRPKKVFSQNIRNRRSPTKTSISFSDILSNQRTLCEKFT